MSADQPKVLVVEDEPAQREVLAYNLEAEGFRVDRAENGDEALLLVDEAAPDVIVLDWMLPGVRDRGVPTAQDTLGNPGRAHHHAERAQRRGGPGEGA